MEFIILAVIILGIVAVTQLFKIYELSRELRPNEPEVITESDNRFNARLGIIFLVAFFAFCIWGVMKWKGEFLPEPASKHGVEIDQLMDLTLVIIGIPFFICNALLFYFVYKYYWRKNRKADFFAHSNKLEAVWTIVPAIVLSALIIYGMRVWSDVTGYTTAAQSENPVTIELYARQFDWTARYAGNDGKLGDADFRMINGTNALGLITPGSIETRLHELDSLIIEGQKAIDNQLAVEGTIYTKKAEPVDPHAKGGHDGGHGNAPHPNPEAKSEHGNDGEHAAGGHHEDPYANASKVVRALVDELEHLKRLRTNIANFATKKYIKSDDDMLVKGEFHIPVNRPVIFQFRAQDVIHSAFLPHFRAQMNCVPGMKTFFAMTPTITTAEMRKKTGNNKFEYYLLCNKICGNAHYNMKMLVVVETEAEYDAWLKTQKTFTAPPQEAAAVAMPADSLKITTDTIAAKK